MKFAKSLAFAGTAAALIAAPVATAASASATVGPVTNAAPADPKDTDDIPGGIKDVTDALAMALEGGQDALQGLTAALNPPPAAPAS